MKAIVRIFFFSLCATFHASAQSSGENVCAALADRITPDISRQVTSGAHLSILQQLIRDQFYFKCLQSRGQKAGSALSAPAKAGTFTTFDVPGALTTNPTAINPARAITGVYFDAGGLSHSFLRTPDGAITPFDPPGATCSVSTSSLNLTGEHRV